MVPALNRLVSFRVVRPNSKKDAKESPGSAPNLLTSKTTAKEGTIRIQWNLNLDDLRTCLDDNELSRDDLRRRTRSLHTIKQLYDDAEAPLHPAYESGSCVEYFSVTHRQWLSGIVTVEHCASGPHDSEQAFSYSVTLTRGKQFRSNVDLDLVRPPLIAGELVELFSDEQDEPRIPAYMAEMQNPSPVLLGYRVVVQATGKTLERVSASKLARRFPRGQRIEVYRGANLGWQEVFVHESATEDGCGAKLLPVPAAPTFAREDEERMLLAMRTDVSRQHNTVVSGPICTPRVVGVQDPSSSIGPWTMVPVRVGCNDQDCSVEFVPSCLLRKASSISCI